MAHHLHTKKEIRQTAKRTRRNRTDKSKMRTAIKRFLAAGNTEEKFATMKHAQKMIDRVAKKHIIHKNTASRRKSQLAVAYNNFAKSHS